MAECEFVYPVRWWQLKEQIEKLFGPTDEEEFNRFLELQDFRDRAIEDHLAARPCGGGAAASDYGQLQFTSEGTGFAEIYSEGTVTTTINGVTPSQGWMTTGKAGVWDVSVNASTGFTDYTTIPAIGWVTVDATNVVSGVTRLGIACSGLTEVDDVLLINGAGSIDMNLAADSDLKITNYYFDWCDGSGGTITEVDIWITCHYVGPAPVANA